MQISTRSYCYLLFWFGLIALCAHLSPYFANDYRYFLIQGSHELVSSYMDIIESQYQHYFEWGGRTVAHVIAQLLLFWGKPVSAVVQALCYITLILFIYYNAYGIRPTLKLRFMPIFTITALLFLQLRVFGEVVFNIVSSANYLYTVTIALMFLLPYRISMRHDVQLNSAFLWPLMMVLGLLAGWSNENTAAAVATFVGLYLLYNLKQRRLKFWQCIGYAAFLVGFALLVFAPGNGERFDSMEDKGFDYVGHIDAAFFIFCESLLVNILLLLALAFVIVRVKQHFLQFARPALYHGSMWFVAMGFFALFLMIFSPNFPARAATPFTVFVITGTVGLSELLRIRGHKLMSTPWRRTIVTITSVLMATIIVNMVYNYVLLKNDSNVRMAEISKQLDMGERNLVVSPMRVNTYKYVYAADVRASPEYWTNLIEKNFYQVDSIVRSCDYPKRALDHDFIPLTFFLHEECNLLPKPEVASK